ncbi:037L [Iridovirus CN01]|nr:037L [Iridovirus CN01]UPA43591.1 037L [Iridovirus CN01]
MVQQKNLTEFLKTMRCPNDPSYSHVSMGFPKGVFSFGTKMKEFWKIYTDSIESGNSPFLAEKPGKEIPVLCDVDLKVKKSSREDPTEKLYTDHQLKKIIAAYEKAILEVVDFSNVDEMKKNDSFTCVLLEKEPYEIEIAGETFIKNGFHLHFPKLFLDRKAQEVYIIPKVIEYTQGTFDNIKITNFIDTNVTNVRWLMYGSRKENGTPYVATKCFVKGQKQISLKKGLSGYKCSTYPGEEQDDVSCDSKETVEKNLPRILSIFLYDRADDYFFSPKPTVITPMVKEFEDRKSKRKQYDNDNIQKNIQDAEVLIGMMNVSRADDRATWLKVGFCIWNISGGDSDGLSLWLEFSEQSDKFNEAECISQWHKMRPNNFTIGTLKFYAKKDNSEEYNKYVSDKTTGLILEAVEGCHNDIAKILFNEYGTDFICTSIRDKEWYQFKDHIWKPLDRGTSLRERISDDNGIVLKKLREYKDKLGENYRQAKEDGDEDAEEILKEIKKTCALIKQCKSSTFKNHVMVESQEVFYNPEFYNLLNKNPNLIAFKNGVYDFENDVFRDGSPEDYLSVKLPIDYIDYGTIDHPEVIAVDNFFQKVFPNIEIRDYFLDQASFVFVGGNHNKVILFWTGEGNNGKTVTQTLFEKMLGKFAIKFNTSLITGKKANMGAASPELARAGDGVRWAVMDEPNADEIISSGTLKGLTGNDSYWARDLFQRGKETKEIIPFFKLHMICNKLPAIKDADQATWNRIRVIPFESTFKHENDCPVEFEEQMKQKTFPMDKNFTEKIPEMVKPLAWYLIQRWKTIRKCEIVEPEIVTVATSSYRNENDIYKQFEDQCIHQEKNGNLSFTVLYSVFKDWFKEEYPNMTIPIRQTIRKHFISKFGQLERGRWKNFICKKDEDDFGRDSDEDGDDVVNPALLV